MPRQKQSRGRPPKYQMPEPIDADPETIAEVALKAKPKVSWRFDGGEPPSKEVQNGEQ